MKTINVRVAIEIFGWREFKTISNMEGKKYPILAPNKEYLESKAYSIPREGYYPNYILVPNYANDLGLAIQAAWEAGVTLPLNKIPKDILLLLQIALVYKNSESVQDAEYAAAALIKESAVVHTPYTPDPDVEKIVEFTQKVFTSTPPISETITNQNEEE